MKGCINKSIFMKETYQLISKYSCENYYIFYILFQIYSLNSTSIFKKNLPAKKTTHIFYQTKGTYWDSNHDEKQVSAHRYHFATG